MERLQTYFKNIRIGEASKGAPPPISRLTKTSSLITLQSHTLHDHHYCQQNIINHEIPDQIAEHNYAQYTQVKHIHINMEYADDISVISSDNHKALKSERDNTNKLSKKGLSINDTKTERYTINRNDNSWKKCKLLGSLLDTDEEIKRRKSLGINAANNLEHLFKNKHLTTATKMKVMDTYVKPIFMYNSEL